MNRQDQVKYKVVGSIGVVTLDDPPGNELPCPEFIPLELLQQWTSDPGLRGLIITGEGRNFSAGGKLDTIFQATDHYSDLEATMKRGHLLLNYLAGLDIPVIAAINRVCFGGGLETALACHLRVASENALLAFPEVNHNLMPGMGGTFRLPGLAGFAESVKMILGGDTVTAAEAKALGIIDFIAPKDQAFEHALALMHKMTHDRQIRVIRSIMRVLKNASMLSREEAIKEEIRLFCSLAMDEAERRRKEEA